MRVFVFGAGASLHAGYPLAGALGNCLAMWTESLPADHDYRELINHLHRWFGGVEDFETVVSELLQPVKKADSLDDYAKKYAPDLIRRAVRDFFNDIRKKPTELYDELANHLQAGDVIITFNYDLAVEHALRRVRLWNLTNGYGFFIPVDESECPIKVLKLHGSTNWSALLFGGRTRGAFANHGKSLGDRPVIFYRDDLEYLGYGDFFDPRCGGRQDLPVLPVMILPAIPKQFYFDTSLGYEWREFWNGLWFQADDALRKADEVIIIGYSLPKIDTRARELILCGAQRDAVVRVCCAGATEAIRGELVRAGFAHVYGDFPSFSDYLASAAKLPRVAALTAATTQST